MDLSYLYEKPCSKGYLKVKAEDFIVSEDLGFVLDDSGEHHYLQINKSLINTQDVAKVLSSFAKVHPKEVTYAGLKDKHSVAIQWFCVRIPGKITPPWYELEHPNFKVVNATRHGKKLRIGNLEKNHFKIRLRKIDNIPEVLKRLELIKQGVPNYFGSQRFGFDNNNIEMGRKMLSGQIAVGNRNKKSIYISALRSYIFNCCVSMRIDKLGVSPQMGDCVMLAGSNSFFTVDNWDQALLDRLNKRDILLSAPLYGKGELHSKLEAACIEAQILGEFKEDTKLLDVVLDMQRRPLLMFAENLTFEVIENDLTLDFSLPSGFFATSLIRELIDLEEREGYADISK